MSEQFHNERYYTPSRRYLAAPSVNSNSTTSSYQSYKPLVDSESPSSRTPRTSEALKKTKKFLSSLGEPPTAEYDRQQAAKQSVKTNGREAFGAINYGPYRSGGAFGGGKI